jgi:hypothetical protein
VDEVWFDEQLADGRRLRLAVLSPHTRRCLEATSRTLRKLSHQFDHQLDHQLDTSDPAGSVTPRDWDAWFPTAEQTDPLPRFDDYDDCGTVGFDDYDDYDDYDDDELYRHLPVWHISSDPCQENGSCCERTELGLALGAASDPSRAATAHLSAIADIGAALSSSAAELVGAPEVHPCSAHEPLLNHCAALDTALAELCPQLAIAAAAYRLTVKVDRR